MSRTAVELPRTAIEDYCRRWQITELALFGAISRDDFGPERDVDMLVTFASDARWSLFDAIRMDRELFDLLGRKVDLASRWAIERSDNWMRRREILGTTEPFSVAR